MSVYRRDDSTNYSYDFQIKGLRFSGTLPTKNKKDAERLEKEIKEREKLNLASSQSFDKLRMPFQIAATRYWDQVGQHHVNAATTWKSLGWLTKAIGGATLLTQIDDTKVAELVAIRRNEVVPSNKKSGPKPTKKVGPATVNRTMTEVLRKVMLHAQKIEQAAIGDVTWKNHKLKEPRERIREASDDEEAGVMDQLERGYDDAVAFAFASGCRRMEIIGLIWNKVDFGLKVFTVLGKGNKERQIPMTSTLFQLLWKQQGKHPEKVFTYEAAKTSKKVGYERLRGLRYPLTDAGLKSAMSRAVSGAGVTNLHFHDTRHTMATRTLRKSNIKVVQVMLGHDKITTTEKYAHAMVEDVRSAMEAATTTKSPTGYIGASHNALHVIEKSA